MLALRITVNETIEARILGQEVVFKHPGYAPSASYASRDSSASYTPRDSSKSYALRDSSESYTLNSSELTDLFLPETEQLCPNITTLSLAPFPFIFFTDAQSGATICMFQDQWWRVTLINVEEESVALFLARAHLTHQYIVPRDAFAKKLCPCISRDDLVLPKK